MIKAKTLESPALNQSDLKQKNQSGLKKNTVLKKQRLGLPALMLCLYFLAMPLSLIPLPGGISLLKLVTLAAVAVLIPLLFIGDNEIHLNGMHLAWAIYLIYSFSTLFLLRDDISIDTFRGLLETSVLAFLVSIRVYNGREQRWIYNTWLLVGMIMVLLMLFSSNIIETADGRETISLFGNTEDPNQLSGYFILPMVICLDRAIKNDGGKNFRIFYVFFMLIMIYVVFRSGSRGGLAAILATVAIYVVLAVNGAKNRIITAVVIAAAAVIVIYVILPMMPESVMERFNLDRILEDRGSNRFDIWAALLSDLKNNIGSFTFGKGFYATAATIEKAGIGNTVAHNQIIQVLYDQGFVGCLLFIIMLFTGGIRMYKEHRAVTLSLIGMMALAMSLTMYPYYKPFWNVLMMSALNFIREPQGSELPAVYKEEKDA